MITSKTGRLPARLEAAVRRFERWRQTHKPRSRIPDSLWTMAAKMAGVYGLHRTARTLRVAYYSLKRHVEQSSATVPRKPASGTATAFVEWPAAVPLGPCDCRLELDNGAGAKMRVHLQAATPPDLAALSRSFWNPAP
jgi:hypothetical protein